jgi:plasmid stability protein
MPSLIVRKLDQALVRKLKARAAQNNRSMEAEHRAILHRALAEPATDKSLKDRLLAMPNVGADEDFERPKDLGRDSAI